MEGPGGPGHTSQGDVPELGTGSRDLRGEAGGDVVAGGNGSRGSAGPHEQLGSAPARDLMAGALGCL